MKIKEVTTVLLTGPCTLDPYLSEARKLRSAAFIKIETTEGLVGIGETYGGYFFPESIPAMVDFFKPILIGADAGDIRTLWQRMYHCGNFWCRVGLGAIALTGIEAALWDLKGKEAGVPVYRLLQEEYKKDFRETKQHEKLPCYATGGPSNYPLDKLAGKIDYYCSLGFKGVKVGAGAYYKDRGSEISGEPEAAAAFEAAKLRFIRERFGKELWLMLDAHMGNHTAATWNLETALAVAKAVEPEELFFLEEPLHYTRPDWYAELCRNTKTRIAGGECLTAASEWQTFTDMDCFHIGQPDAAFVSGLGPFMEIAARLSAKNKSIAPHAWGAGAAQMQNIHCGFACSNTVMLEVAPAYGPLHSELIRDSLCIKEGYVLPPEKPGLGIELTDATIARFPFVPGSGEFNSVPGKILTT
ncbi:mandelate racemase/muconate lactonizing enzyme family protein [Niabella beijingensis]|uniref:mandelate racemase/muconate lactonizing enzyme family protein n=1 Tax=Niabella beijingensis TaxID=2872700 RepID=UPI001CBAC51D|nr:mandelate racemase/muconate lactonizing enzyme family protein [Niabella beijingensis]MBZ4190901.1 mandelate racemase/muconate lactonizing enzyme family protein [Niabella beijingensis]